MPDTIIDTFRARLNECLTLPAVDKVQVETWAQLDIRDGVRNTIVLQESGRKREQLKQSRGMKKS